MKLDSLSPELAARIKTAIPLAAGVSLIIFSPDLIVGLVVIVYNRTVGFGWIEETGSGQLCAQK